MEPLPLDDYRWPSYQGGYRVSFDASVPLRKLISAGPSKDLWDSLWTELHHQGDVGSASYAAVPWLVEFLRRSPRLEWNALSLIAVIEFQRPSNPEITPELKEPYFAALRALPALIGQHGDSHWDELTVRSAVTCIALARGQRWFAKACFELDRDTAGRWFNEEFGWEFDDA